MPVMKALRAQQGRSETRDRILDAALELFARDGYEATPVRKIAARCGLTDAALYYYFQSKQEILETLIAERWDIYRSVRAGLQPCQQMDRRALERLVDDMIEGVAANDTMVRFIARQCLTGDQHARHIRQVRQRTWRDAIVAQFDERFSRDDAELLADTLINLLIGISFTAQVAHGERFAEAIRDPACRARVHALVHRTIPLERFIDNATSASAAGG